MFKLDFPLKPNRQKINLKDSVYLIGSCFSDEIGALFTSNKFKNLSNPFGTIYNPCAIFKIVRGEIDTHNLIKSHEIYYHWDAHGELAALQESDLIQEVEKRLNVSMDFLKECKWLIITLGTAWAYRYKETNQIVANCHKVPHSKFNKELLSIDRITDSFKSTKAFLRKLNPTVNIILTVSPVRHLRDGLVENNRSKARLIEAVHQIVEQDDNTSYFPSYEIVIDELRDYRFYSEDLVHPSKQAVDYIWSKFSDRFFDHETTEFLNEWRKVVSALNHTPFMPESKEHQGFLKTMLNKLEKLNQKMDLSVEMKAVKEQLL